MGKNEEKWFEKGRDHIKQREQDERDEVLKDKGTKVFNRVAEGVDGAKEWIEDKIDNGAERVKGLEKGAGDSMKRTAGRMVEAVEFTKDTGERAVGYGKEIGSELKGAGEKAWEGIVGIKDRLVKGAGEAKDGLFTRLGGLKDKAISKAETFKDKGKKFGIDAVALTKNKINKTSEAVKNSYEGVKGGAKEAYEGAKETYKDTKEGVKEAYRGAERWYREDKLTKLLEEIEEKQKQAEYLKKELGKL